MANIQVDVRSNLKSVRAEFSAYVDAASDSKAIVRALNRAQDQAVTATSREIRKVYNVKHRAILNAIKKHRANKTRLYAVMELKGTRIPLIEFGATWKRGQSVGASVRVKVRGNRKRVAGSFIGMHGTSNARQVFVRIGKERYPIKALRSISVPQGFNNDVVVNAINKLAAESFEKNYEQQLRFLRR